MILQQLSQPLTFRIHEGQSIRVFIMLQLDQSIPSQSSNLFLHNHPPPLISFQCTPKPTSGQQEQPLADQRQATGSASP